MLYFTLGHGFLVLNFLFRYFTFHPTLLEWFDPSVAEERDLVVPAGDGPRPARRRALLRLLVDEQVLTHAEPLCGNKSIRRTHATSLPPFHQNISFLHLDSLTHRLFCSPSNHGRTCTGRRASAPPAPAPRPTPEMTK